MDKRVSARRVYRLVRPKLSRLALLTGATEYQRSDTHLQRRQVETSRRIASTNSQPRSPRRDGAISGSYSSDRREHADLYDRRIETDGTPGHSLATRRPSNSIHQGVRNPEGYSSDASDTAGSLPNSPIQRHATLASPPIPIAQPVRRPSEGEHGTGNSFDGMYGWQHASNSSFRDACTIIS